MSGKIFYLNSYLGGCLHYPTAQIEVNAILDNPSVVKDYLPKDNLKLQMHHNLFDNHNLFSSLQEGISSFNDTTAQFLEFDVSVEDLIQFIRQDKILIPIKAHYFVWN